MHHIPTTATAVEKLNREAKAYCKANGCPLGHALDLVAVRAGYTSWKHVTVCAAQTAPRGLDALLRPRHRHLITEVYRPTMRRRTIVKSVEDLCEQLGGIRPYFARQRCGHAPAGQHCLCELDPFATSMQANIKLDVGDKYDDWNLLFMPGEPAREFPGWEKRVYMGLATWDPYPNEHLTMRSNRDRSNALNPNNPAHQASVDNRSMQLDPQNSRFGGAADED
jgi:hypothetical protein